VSLHQAHYTSCERGLGPGSGFQFSSASPDLDRATLTELERVVLYGPPAGSPPEPSAEEIARMPVRFAYRQLYGGGAAVLRSAYLGRDYSERYGNFFTHALVLPQPERDLQGRLPVELLDADFWVQQQAPDRELPDLALPMRPPATDVLAPLRRPDRAAAVAAAVDAVLGAAERRWRLVVVDEDDAAHAWLELATRVLPIPIALELSFSSFEGEPRRAEVDLAIAPLDADIAFPGYELGRSVQLVGPGAPPAEPAEASLLALVVGDWVARGDDDALTTFADEMLARRLHGEVALEDLGVAAVLHAGHVGTAGPSARLRALGFAACHPSAAFAARELAWLLEGIGPDAAAAVTELLADVGAGPSSAVVRDLALDWCLRHPAASGRALPSGAVAGVVLDGARAERLADGIAAAPGHDLPAALRLARSFGGGGLPALRDVAVRLAPGLLLGDEAAIEAAAELDAEAAARLVPVLARGAGGRRDVAADASPALRSPGMRAALDAYARRTATFRERLEATALLAEAGELPRKRLLEFLGAHAHDDVDRREAVTLIYGSQAPRSTAEAAELLRAFGRGSPGALIRRGEGMLRDAAPGGAAEEDGLAEALIEAGSRDGVVEAAVLLRPPRTDVEVLAWARRLVAVFESSSLTAAHREALAEVAGRRIAAVDDAGAALAVADGVVRQVDWLGERVRAALAGRFEARDHVVAAAWFAAARAKRTRPGGIAVTVDTGLDGWKAKDRDQLARLLPAGCRDAWRRWEEEHPAPVGAVGRLTSRFRRTRGG